MEPKRDNRGGEIIWFRPTNTEPKGSVAYLGVIVSGQKMINHNNVIIAQITSENDGHTFSEFIISLDSADLERRIIKEKSSIRMDRLFIIQDEQILQPNVAILKKAKFEEVLKSWIKLSVRNYYDSIHIPSQTAAFIAGRSKIPYAGRVFDEKEMINLIDACLEFYLTGGRYDVHFCHKLSDYLQTNAMPKVNVLTVNSGSSANLIAIATLTSPKLGELAIKEGDEVICVAAGFPTSITPIIQNKLIPVFIDVELGSYNIDVSKIEKALTEKTRAIFLAHTLGIPFDLDNILEIAESYKLWVVEDNCDALGAEFTTKKEYNLIKDKRSSGILKTGTIGHIGTSSFYPAHQITMGEGGAVYTSDNDLYRIALSFRDWGRDCWCMPGRDNTCNKRFEWKYGLLPKGYDHKYTYSHLGYNFKITDMQAAIGVAQMDKLPLFVSSRYRNWKKLREGLNDLGRYFILPEHLVGSKPSPFGFALTVRDSTGFTRDELTRFLEKNHIQTRTLFAGNMLRQPAFTNYDVRLRINGSQMLHSNMLSAEDIVQLRNTDIVMRDTFWIGVYPGLTEDMVDFMIGKIREFVQSL